MRGKASERGAALLTVLLLVAVISVLAAGALEKLRLSTRLAANGAAIEQARAYAYAAETVATIRVNAILNQDAARTTLAGGWAGRPYTLPVLSLSSVPSTDALIPADPEIIGDLKAVLASLARWAPEGTN